MSQVNREPISVYIWQCHRKITKLQLKYVISAAEDCWS